MSGTPPAMPISDPISVLDTAYNEALNSRNGTIFNRLDKLEALADQTVQDLVAKAQNKQDLITLVRDRRSKLPLSSDITTEVVGICKQVLAFGAAGLGLTLGFADKIVNLAPSLQKAITIGGIFYLEMTLVSLFVLVRYLLQARFRYPFLSLTKIGNTWPHFYYASISEQTPRQEIQTSTGRAEAAMLYAKDFTHFASRIVSENQDEQLRVEVQQYFLLLSFQGYVNQFSLRLTNTFFYGIVGSVITAIILTIWAVIK